MCILPPSAIIRSIIVMKRKGGDVFMMKIFIDPGHGGRDPGATANGLQEKMICLQIAQKLNHILMETYNSVQTRLSRTTDQTLSLKARTDMANRWGADYLISIHVNAGGGTGFESYIYDGAYDNKERSKQCRDSVHEEVIRATNFKDRGKKEANFHMLRESLMPAVLTESGFIDTTNDAAYLQDEDFLDVLAQAHASGIAKALELKQGHVPDNADDQSRRDIHIIKHGDTLWELAKQYGTSVSELREWNHTVVPERLQIGQKLIVGQQARSHDHTIEKGDTLWQLSKQYGTTVAALLKLNPTIEAKNLRVGEKVKVR